jgi:ParB family chromosome partitioning protein
MEQKMLKLGEIYESPVALRPVNKETEKFQELVDSIAARGLINALSVRPMTQDDAVQLKESQEIEIDAIEGKYILCDGLQRFTASKMAGLSEVPALIRNISDNEALVDQFMANHHRIDTLPAQFTQQMVRIMAADPLMTTKEMAKMLAVSEAFVKERMKLIKLHEDIATLVDEGVIKLSNAFALANLPPEEQLNYKEAAINDSSREFAGNIKSRLAELNKAKREGRGATEEFVPPTVATWRNKGEIESMRNNTADVADLLSRNSITDPSGAFLFALTWCMRLDPESIGEAKRKFDERKMSLEEAASKRDEERKRKKLEREVAKLEQMKSELNGNVAVTADTAKVVEV